MALCDNHNIAYIGYAMETRGIRDFYQLATHEARSRLVLRLLCCFHVCWYVRPHLSRAQ